MNNDHGTARLRHHRPDSCAAPRTAESPVRRAHSRREAEVDDIVAARSGVRVMLSGARPRPRVVIAGGGIAGIETLLALRDLAEDRVRITLVSPRPAFEPEQLRAASVFSLDHVRPHSLGELCRANDAKFVEDRVEAVDPDARKVALARRDALSYDALVLAIGATRTRPFSRGLMFGLDRDTNAFSDLLSDLEAHYSHSVAFVVPPGTSWPLPLYELALMTAGQVRSMGIDDADIQIVTPEADPLSMFGAHASTEVRQLLQMAGIRFRGGVAVEPAPDGRLAVGGRPLGVQRVVTIPLITGRPIPGITRDDDGFIPVDDHGRVDALTDVFAAGDGANYPIKQGGLACQMADAIAELLAARAGAPVERQPFRPVLRGKLLTGHGARYLRRALSPEHETSETSAFELWYPPTKLSGRYISQWLQMADGVARDVRAHEGHIEVEAPLPRVGELGRGRGDLDPLEPLPHR